MIASLSNEANIQIFIKLWIVFTGFVWIQNYSLWLIGMSVNSFQSIACSDLVSPRINCGETVDYLIEHGL